MSIQLNIYQYRTLINLGADTRALIEEMKNSKLEFSIVMDSINYGYLDADDIINRDFFKYDRYLYNTEDYAILEDIDEVSHIDDACFCEYSGYYVSAVEEVHVGREGRDETQYWSKDIAEDKAYLIDGEYYQDPYAYNFVTTCDGDWAYQDDVYYWESTGEYHCEPEPEPEEQFTSSYHGSAGGLIEFTQNPKFFIGVEIEKEDQDIKESINIDEFTEQCPGWRKERDGSLDDDSGYELITPTMELNVKKIHDHIKVNEVLVKHINARKSLACGGHINVSEKGKSGKQLFECIKGYTPLFYALYYKRIDKNYCKGKKNKDLQDENEKYQAVKIHDNRVEYRIVSAVPNLETLIWRIKLMDFILKNQTDDVKQAFFKITSGPFKKHLQKMYTGDRYNILINRIIEMTAKFEDIKINE